MALVEIGNQSGWSNNYTELIKIEDTTPLQLEPSDCGKTFYFKYPDDVVNVTINLPQLSDIKPGWNCRLRSRADAGETGTMQLLAYGVANGGGATGDANTVTTHNYVAGADDEDGDTFQGTQTGKDGLKFPGQIPRGNSINVLTDGATWFMDGFQILKASITIVG